MTVKETIMKKLLTSAALALTLTAAGMTSYAVNWVCLGQDGNDRIYYDTSSVSRQGNLVAVTMQEREERMARQRSTIIFLIPTGRNTPLLPKLNMIETGTSRKLKLSMNRISDGKK